MSILSPLVTVAIFLPFSLLTLYYFQSILRQTLRDSVDLTTWTDYLCFSGLLFFQIAIILLIGILTWIVLEAKLGS